MQTNPWIDVDLAPTNATAYVHPADADHIAAYNSKVCNASFRLSLHMLPEPWVGNLDAPVVVLLANPGATEAETQPTWRPIARQRELAQQALRQDVMEYPFYWLHPDLAATDGGKWYGQKLRWLIDATSTHSVAQNLLTLETHAYHSRKFDASVNKLPTQAFQAEILRRAIQRDALIVALRVRTQFWEKLVPELGTYAKTGRVLQTRNPIQAALSPNNLIVAKDVRETAKGDTSAFNVMVDAMS